MNMDLEPVDALKGLAALLIAFFHWSAFTWWADARWLAHLWLMVDLLFVITGFVLAGVYRNRMRNAGDFGVFAVLRLVRIYPIHLFFLLPLAGVEVMKQIYFAFGLTGGDATGFAAANLSSAGLWAHLSLTQAFGWHAAPGWNQPAWYAAIEFWVSLLFALACLGGFMRNLWGRLAMAMTVIAALIWMLTAGDDLRFENGGAFARGLFSFGCGAAAQSLLSIAAVAGFMDRVRKWGGGGVELCALALTAWFLGAVSGGGTFAAPLIFALLAMLFTNGAGKVSMVLKRPAFQRLGRFSYSIYMSHFLFILPLAALSKADGGQAVAMYASLGVGLYLCMTVAIAVVMENLIEAPMRKLARRWLSRRSWAQRSDRGRGEARARRRAIRA